MTSFRSWLSRLRDPVFTMHGRLLGCRLPLVVHVAVNVGCATIVIARFDLSPSGIVNDSDAPVLPARFVGALSWTTADPTKPHPLPLFVAPLRCWTILAEKPLGALSLNPVVGFDRS